MRVLVCGGRDYGRVSDEIQAAYDWLDGLRGGLPEGQNIEIIHGCARGADSIAGSWASERGVPVHAFPADWNKHGRAAGPIRNRQMLVEGKPDLVVAFPGGRGTANMIAQAKAAGVEVMQVPA
jgi:hypothetical protein